MKRFYVYILASQKNGTLYTGVTSNMSIRLEQHLSKAEPGFTAKYNIHKLVYVESVEGSEAAFKREKQIKHWNRDWKIALIEQENPHWCDLSLKKGFIIS